MPIRSQFENEAEWLAHIQLWLAGQALSGIAAALTEATSRGGDENTGQLLLDGITGSGALAYALADATLAARPAISKARPS